MANKEKIDYLLLDIRELETLIAGMRDAEVYPVSFFCQTFDLTHKILNDLHTLESAQIEMLCKQMEAHQALIQSIPRSVGNPMPVAEEPVRVPVCETAPVKEAIIEKIEPEVIIEEQKDIQPEPTGIPLVAEHPAPKVTSPTLTDIPHHPIENTPKTIVAEKTGIFFSDLLEKKNLSDFRKAFSLNDRFRFRRELFGGDEDKMNKAIADLNEIHTYEESVTYLNNELKWNLEDEGIADFIRLLEKRFL